MESPRLRLLPLLGAALLLLLPLLGALAQEDAELQPRALDIYSAVEDASHEKELVGTPLAPDFPGSREVPCFVRVSLSLPASPPRFLDSGSGEVGTNPRLPLSPEERLEPCAPDSLWSKSLIPAPRSNRSLRGSWPCGQYVGQRSLSFHPSNVPLCGVQGRSVWCPGSL